MMQVIALRDSKASYRDECPSPEYKGVLFGLSCGWQFEMTKDGKVEYTSVTFFEGDADECAACGYALDWYTELGWRATGRAVFRGYYTEHYDYAEREEYYIDATDDEIRYAVDYTEAHREPSEDEMADEYEEYYRA